MPLSKIRKEELKRTIEAMEHWVEPGHRSFCPFAEWEDPDNAICGDLCARVIEKHHRNGVKCPCAAYGRAYVILKVQEMIKEYREGS